MRIAAMADLHFTRNSHGLWKDTFAAVTREADVLLLGGDLTDYGLPDEAQALVSELKASVGIPVVAVLGNHDFESGKQLDIQHLLSQAGVHVLDGDACEIDGVGFAGVKGFAGGFGRGTLGPWGEQAVKSFVQEAVNEALKLESALARLRMPHRVALLHYAPIPETVAGEPIEIFPWLGCSRLEEPLNRYPVEVAFHGHAHHGHPEGKTRSGVPVYNVAVPLLRQQNPGQPPVRYFEIAESEERRAESWKEGRAEGGERSANPVLRT